MRDQRLIVALATAVLSLQITTPAMGRSGAAQAQPPASPQRTGESGRVIATVTVLEGTVRMGGVHVERR